MRQAAQVEELTFRYLFSLRRLLDDIRFEHTREGAAAQRRQLCVSEFYETALQQLGIGLSRNAETRTE